MGLEEELHKVSGHHLYYRPSKSENMILRSFANSFDPETSVCFVTRDVLLNPIHVLKEAAATIKCNKKNFVDLPKLVKSMYGQIRSLRTLADTDKLITTVETMDAFSDSVLDLKLSTARFLYFYKHSQSYNEECRDFLYTLLGEVDMLSRGLWNCEYRGNRLMAEQMLKIHQETDLCNKKIRFSTGTYSLSREDLLLYVIASYESTNKHQGRRSYILVNNPVFLTQGPLLFGLFTFKAPDLLYAETEEGFGKNFQHHFKLYQQPHYDIL